MNEWARLGEHPVTYMDAQLVAVGDGLPNWFLPVMVFGAHLTDIATADRVEHANVLLYRRNTHRQGGHFA